MQAGVWAARDMHQKVPESLNFIKKMYEYYCAEAHTGGQLALTVPIPH